MPIRGVKTLVLALGLGAAMALCAGATAGAIAAPATEATAKACVPACWCPPTSVTELVSWRRADVVTAKLANGVVVHHRRMPDQGFTVVAATLAPGFDHETDAFGAAEAVEALLKADVRAAGLNIDAMGGKQGLTLVMRGGDDRAGDMVALVGRIASEKITFEAKEDARWRAQSARTRAWRAIDDVLEGRPIDVMRVDDADGRAKLWPAEGSEPGAVEVAIVGGVALADALSAAHNGLGELLERAAPAPINIAKAAPVPVGGVEGAGERSVVLRADDAGLEAGREMVVVSLLVRRGTALVDQRAISLASTVLRQRLTPPAEGQPRADVHIGAAAARVVGGGGPELKPSVMFTPRGPRPGVGQITVIVTCPDGEGARVISDVQESLRRMAQAPAPEEELDQARTAYIETADKLLADVGYWAGVLASCSSAGISPDDLAMVHSDIRKITGDDLVKLMSRAMADNPPVTVRVRPVPKPAQP